MKKLLTDMVKRIWKNKGMPAEIDRQLAMFFASEFWKAVVEGYGVDPEKIDFDTPDHDMLRSLEQSVYQFASAKNYAQLKSISQALLDDRGALRTFSQFRQAAAEINNEFVNQWLKAEYNFATASGQMASRWKQFEAEKELFPLLRYDTAGDERVRLEHQELEDVIRPVDDPFWDIYFPPNGWNCRCDVQQLDSGRITPMEKISLPEKMPEMFKYNSGKKGVAFPPGHPYYDGLPGDVKNTAFELWKENSKLKNGNTE
ncbi:MAG: phage head morphogenesis protein [Bacteroidota bacterium]